jgi:hypothetical protein
MLSVTAQFDGGKGFVDVLASSAICMPPKDHLQPSALNSAGPMRPELREMADERPALATGFDVFNRRI